ncbi:MAG: acetyl/propionyl/methylcrotonyl-CoA carboxylase subunit alpha [Alphaproteobacteria bacterium]|nr:acetyl/propionyl/methylcrotonyl-CoA carboxylase subunit alpha [Alphaproteobacteria bacterium]
MLKSLLIANRGEIACRVARTARRLGLRTIAVYSEADRDARHVHACDEAHPIGPAPARESYLRIERILEAARKAGAEAIHPGYGFLSENAGFAEACAAAGIVFVGPPASAIRAMGSKSAAKALMERTGVPLVPGYHGDDQAEAKLTSEARRIGFPVLVKASAGGGGKGMRIVGAEKDFSSALASAKREAASSFGDDRVLVEKYLTRPRHIEIQVFADAHGNCVYLHERDCSIQRRHQKVLEEAPAPGMTPARRQEMGEAAVAAARAVGYRGAGTVEFIAEGERFYFMEMNTRLQVEHPVTEMITGQDLVEWQLRVASGEPLPLRQNDIPLDGHAMEVRLYAEDPARDFLPQTGTLHHLIFPAESASVRIDTGVGAGDTIGIHYDPMIAKIIVHAADRESCARRLARALSEVEVVGLATNAAFLKRLADHPAFVSGEVDTGFLARHGAEVIPAEVPASDRVIALATLAKLQEIERNRAGAAGRSNDRHSPWNDTRGWRLNDEGLARFQWKDGERDIAVIVHFEPTRYRLDLPGGTVAATLGSAVGNTIPATLDGVASSVNVVIRGDEVTVFDAGGPRRLLFVDPTRRAGLDAGAGGRLTAPMPGKLVQVLVRPGDKVEKGQPLVVLEAMKMEHTVKAPRAGKVAEVGYAAGEQVEEGASLVELEE